MNCLFTRSTPSDECELGPVRVIATAIDKFHGLKGHDYIKARNLNPPVKRVQTSAHDKSAVRIEVCQ